MKAKLQKKSVLFGGKTYTLYSLDGSTWSTNADELSRIEDRLRAQREGVKESLSSSVKTEAEVAVAAGPVAAKAKGAVKASKEERQAAPAPKLVSVKGKKVAESVKPAQAKKSVQAKVKQPIVANKRVTQKPKKQARPVATAKKGKKSLSR